MLRRRIGRLGPRLGLRTVWQGAASPPLGAAVVGLLVVKLLPGGGTPGRLEALLQLVVGGAVIGGTYLGLAMLLRVREISQVVGMVRRRLGR